MLTNEFDFSIHMWQIDTCQNAIPNIKKKQGEGCKIWHFPLIGFYVWNKNQRRISELFRLKPPADLPSTIWLSVFTLNWRKKKIGLIGHISHFKGFYKVMVELKGIKVFIHLDSSLAGFKSLPSFQTIWVLWRNKSFADQNKVASLNWMLDHWIPKLFCKLNIVTLSNVDEAFKPPCSKSTFILATCWY